MEATKEGEIKMSVQLAPQLGQQLQWNLLPLGTPESSTRVLSLGGAVIQSHFLGAQIRNHSMLLTNQHCFEQLEKRTKYKTNTRIWRALSCSSCCIA